MNKLAWATATQAVETASSILLVTHMNPDGDAIGSMVGLANAFRPRGKRIDMAVDDGLPVSLRFLPGADGIRPQLTSGEWDLMISLDASDEERTGVVGAYGRAHSKIVMNVDHHPTNTWFGSIYLIDTDVVSTTAIIEQWLTLMSVPMTQEIAIPLLTGLVTDTRGFRTSNVTPETLATAQRLMQTGASLADIIANTLDNIAYQVLELWKYVLPSMQIRHGVVSVSITQADLRQAGLNEMTDGGLVNLLASASEAAIAIIFKETDEGEIGLSIRSKPGFDVSGVALGLGGGGHKQAAGATIPGPMDAARERVLPLLYAVAREQAAVSK